MVCLLHAVPDFAVHQFLVYDDGREGSAATGDDSGSVELARSAAVAADDHFNSDSTPDAAVSVVQTAWRGAARPSRKWHHSGDALLL